MMAQKTDGKMSRVLFLQQQFLQGKYINKKEIAQRFGVTEKSIQRDIESLRNFFAEQEPRREIVYNARKGGYYLSNMKKQTLNNGELFAVCKILLESRSLTKQEMFPILETLLNNVPKQQFPVIHQLIANEQFYYIEPHHGKSILETLWQIGEAVSRQLRIRVGYAKLKEREPVPRILEPVGIIFSEYYFYLIAYIANPEIQEKLKKESSDRYPAIYRIDRIQSLKILNEHFQVPYLNRFQEGEFRKRVQFMYGGKLRTVRFQYSGLSVEAVLDRLPTAEILEEKDGVFTIQAEVFGETGIDMWLRSQGQAISNITYIGEHLNG